MDIKIIAIGREKNGPIHDLCREYVKRLHWKIEITELTARKGAPASAENDLLLEHIKKNWIVAALDPRGETLGSDEFSRKIGKWQMGGQPLAFVIGGADGLDDRLRGRANFLLSFGKQTWPHMLVRVMLLEQVYRAQQILAGHPYHRA